MNLFTHFSLALLSTNLLFTGSNAVPHHPKLAKRLPDTWTLYNNWESYVIAHPYTYSGMACGPMGTYNRGTRTLTWENDDSEEMVVAWEKTPIAKNMAAIYKGTLQVKKDGKVQSTKTVAIKRDIDDGAEGVVFGASLQMQLAGNENILGALDAMFSSDPLAGHAIMPYISATSLENNFDSYSGQDSVNSAFKQILNAVAAVQSAGIIHRDLKPENFLVDDGTLKLIDFDTAIKAGSSDEVNIGTATYAAPEIVAPNAKSGGSYTNKVDTFSIAMTFLVMSVPELRDATIRFELWKNLIEPKANELWPSADTVASILSAKNYDVFSGNDNLLTVLSNALCEPNTRYDPQSFQSAFENAV